MVYCGKPSKGCGACRARKVKCDQATPACRRCLKNNRVCPGYRDQLSLLFRDETVTVTKKATSTKPVPARVDTPSQASVSSSSEDSIIEPDLVSASSFADEPYNEEYSLDEEDFFLSTPRAPLAIDRTQQAICFSTTNFHWIAACLSHTNIANALSPNAPFSEQAMMRAVASVGMANLSRLGSVSEPLKMSAQREYANALQLTNAAISHSSQATDDATLAAILCLSLFEILTSRRPESVDAFVKHTKGAIALLELRGASQPLTRIGLFMFQFFRSEMIMGCLMRYLPVPPTLLRLSEQASMVPGLPNSFKASHQMSVFLARVNELRNEDLTLKRSSHDDSILARAFALDSELETAINELPPEFRVHIHTSPPNHYFGDINSFHIYPLERLYHSYDDLSPAMTLSHMRYGRLLIHEVIYNRLRNMTFQRDFVPSPEFKNTCYQLRDVSRGIALDICAAVPYLLGYVDGPNASGKLTSTAGGLAILFSVYNAACVDGYGSPTCQWASDCFQMVGRYMGIDQALALVELLPVEMGMVSFIDHL